MAQIESSGTYIITSKLGDFPVGRNKHEDLSLNPKPVGILAKGIEDPKWELEKLHDGHFILKIGGAHTRDIDGKLFAVIQKEPVATHWKLVPQFHHGKNTYTIVLADKPSYGWYVPGDKPFETQIAVRLLFAGHSLPPFYPPQELFVITHDPHHDPHHGHDHGHGHGHGH